MNERKRQHSLPLPERLRALLAFLRDDAAGRRALADILAKHGDRWLEDVGLSRDEARRGLRKSLIRRVLVWAMSPDKA